MTEEPAAYDGGTPPESRILHLAEEPWTKVPLSMASDARLGGSDLNAYIALAWLCGRRGWWYGPQTDIQETAGLTERQVRDSLRRLREAGYILTEPMGIQYANVLRYAIPAVARPLQKSEGAVTKMSEAPPTKMSDASYNHRSIPKKEPQSGADAPARVVKPKAAKPLTEDAIEELGKVFGVEVVKDAVDYWTNHQGFRFAADKPAFLERKLRERTNGRTAPRNAGNQGHPSALQRLREAGRVIG